MLFIHAALQKGGKNWGELLVKKKEVKHWVIKKHTTKQD